MITTKETQPRRQRAQGFFRAFLVSSAYPLSGPSGWCPPTDVYETDQFVVVRVEVAGLRQEDFRVLLHNRRLRVEGVRHDPAAKLVYQQMEIPYGPFCSEVELPSQVDEERVEASYEDGFLTVVLAKAGPHKINIAVED